MTTDNNTPQPLDAKALLREVADKGLIYWEPNTERGHIAKADMLARIEAALAPSTSTAGDEVQRMVERLRTNTGKLFTPTEKLVEWLQLNWTLREDAAALLVQLSEQNVARQHQGIEYWKADAEASRALLAEAAEGLEPFAKHADDYDPPEGDDDQQIWGAWLPTIGQLRRARELVTKLKGALS